MKIEWNRITWYSKLGAIILFILVIPILTFYIGIQYEKTTNILNSTSSYSSLSNSVPIDTSLRPINISSTATDYSMQLKGRFILKDSRCAGFEFGNNPSKVIWRNEVECSISDINPDYYHTEALFWLNGNTFVVKDMENQSKDAPPAIDIYIVEKYDGINLVLKSLWTGWGKFTFDRLELNKIFPKAV
jgi:hypothetical protein